MNDTVIILPRREEKNSSKCKECQQRFRCWTSKGMIVKPYNITLEGSIPYTAGFMGRPERMFKVDACIDNCVIMRNLWADDGLGNKIELIIHGKHLVGIITAFTCNLTDGKTSVTVRGVLEDSPS